MNTRALVIALAALVGGASQASSASAQTCPTWRCGFNGVSLSGLEAGPATPAADVPQTAGFEYTCPAWRCGFNGVNFNGALRNGPVLQGWTLNGLSLNGPVLQGPLLQGPLIQGVQLQGVQLQGQALDGIQRGPARPGVRAVTLADGRRIVVE